MQTPRLPTAVLLVAAALLQLVGQVVLRLPAADGPDTAGAAGSGAWVAAHVVLVLASAALLAATVLLARLAGPGPLTWLGLVLHVAGQVLTLSVLGIDLGLASAPVDVVRTLDTWDFLAVAGAVVVLLELRRRRAVGPGADLALIALAVPAVQGLVVVAAGVMVLGFVALAADLVREHRSSTWLPVLTVVAFAAAGAVSWPRAALAVVVLAWTVELVSGRRAAAEV